MSSSMGTPELPMSDLSLSFKATRQSNGIDDKFRAAQVQSAWTELTSALNIAKSLQRTAQERLNLLSAQEHEISRLSISASQLASNRLSYTLPSNDMPLSFDPHIKDVDKMNSLGEQARTYLQGQIRAEGGLVTSFAQRVADLERVLEETRPHYLEAQYFVSQRGIPVELWRRIFLFAISSTKENRSTPLSHVCRFWRTVTLGYPELWEQIYIDSKSTKLALEECSRFLPRLGRHHTLALNFGPSKLLFKISAWDVETSTPLMRQVDHNVKGQDIAYDMHDLSHLKTLILSSPSPNPNNSLIANVFLDHFYISELRCEEIVPAISPNVGARLRKLTLSFGKSFHPLHVESILRLTPNLEELEFNPRASATQPAIFASTPLLPNLRTLKTTFDVLRSNLLVLGSSPHLRRIGILPTEATPIAFHDVYQLFSDERMTGLKNRVDHLEIHTARDTIYQFGLQSSRLLGLFKFVQTLELVGPTAGSIIPFAHSHLDEEVERSQGSWVPRIQKLIVRGSEVGFFVLSAFMRTHNNGGKRIVYPPLKKLVLDDCTGLSKLQTELLKGRVEVMEIYC